MAAFLSSEWFGDLADRLDGSTSPVRLVIDVVVRGTVETRYRVDAGPDGTKIRQPGDATVADESADLTLFLDEDGARRLAAGETNAQELLADGGLKVRGDLRRILDHADDLAALSDPR